MPDTSVFYKLLEIANPSPSTHEILGLRPGTVAPEAVQSAVSQRVQLLRRRVRDPRLLRLLVQFEKNELKAAARSIESPGSAVVADGEELARTCGGTVDANGSSALHTLATAVELSRRNPYAQQGFDEGALLEVGVALGLSREAAAEEIARMTRQGTQTTRPQSTRRPDIEIARETEAATTTDAWRAFRPALHRRTGEVVAIVVAVLLVIVVLLAGL
jgi:hypothetical protein